MKQELNHQFETDLDGKPAGGVSQAVGLHVVWQNGPLGRGEERQVPNGAFVETLIQCAHDRLAWYQSTEFTCDENQQAIEALKEALAACETRTAKREERDVEGTHES